MGPPQMHDRGLVPAGCNNIKLIYSTGGPHIFEFPVGGGASAPPAGAHVCIYTVSHLHIVVKFVSACYIQVYGSTMLKYSRYQF